MSKNYPRVAKICNQSETNGSQIVFKLASGALAHDAAQLDLDLMRPRRGGHQAHLVRAVAAVAADLARVVLGPAPVPGSACPRHASSEDILDARRAVRAGRGVRRAGDDARAR